MEISRYTQTKPELQQQLIKEYDMKLHPDKYKLKGDQKQKKKNKK